jgi:hypothetical protein
MKLAVSSLLNKKAPQAVNAIRIKTILEADE